MPWTLIGLPPGVVGLVILVGAIVEFAAHGQGTLAPVDPPKVLILRGLYQRTRNPMYVGVLCILVAEAIVFGNFALLLYAVVIFILFHLFVLFYEEPHLRRKYGKPYEEYCKRVPRWPLPVRRRSEEGTGAR